MTSPHRAAPDERLRLGALALGLAFLLLTLVLPPPGELAPAAWRVAGVALLMASWWVGEALPLAATALVPLVLFPPLDVASLKATAAPYAHPLIFLFLGGFLIALAMQRWGLHRRVALLILARTGESPAAIVAGFMAASAFLSMWVSNTATTMMMVPIALSVIETVGPRLDRDGEAAFAPALLLGVAYGASIGGIATLIGTPPNALFAAFVAERYGIEIGFAAWMAVATPLALALLAAAWVVLTRIAFRLPDPAGLGVRGLIADELGALGPLSPGERRTAWVAATTAAAWLTRPALDRLAPGLALSDSGIAVTAALVLFALPVGEGRRVLDWETAKAMPVGVLLLFGGGLSLAEALDASGLAGGIGEALGGLAAYPALVVMLAVVALVVFLTELMSNTAATAAFLPVLAGLAVALEMSPLALALPATVAASCAFMLPVATPPNAVVFASERLTVAEMARTGLILNLIAILAITAVATALLPLLLAA